MKLKIARACALKLGESAYCSGSCCTRFILINDVMLFVYLSSAGVPNVLIEGLASCGTRMEDP